MRAVRIKADHWGTIGLRKIVQKVIEHSKSIRKEGKRVGEGVSENTMGVVSSVKCHFGFPKFSTICFPSSAFSILTPLTLFYLTI